MMFEMFALTRALTVANIIAKYLDITGPDLRVKIFKRTYHDDLDTNDRARIIERLCG